MPLLYAVYFILCMLFMISKLCKKRGITAFYIASLFFSLPFFSIDVFAQKIVVIKPFTVNAPQEYQYLSTALPSIIESRIASSDILAQQGEVEDIHSTIQGSVSVLGNHISVDIRLETDTGGVYIYPISATSENILPEVEQVIPAMQANIQGGVKTLEDSKDSQMQSSLLSITDWQSIIALSIAPRGIRIVDLDNNGEKEYIILGEKELIIYDRNGSIFNEKARYSFKGRQQAKYLAVAPINQEEIGILITVMLDERSPYSYIFTYKNESLVLVRHAEPYLLGAYYDARNEKMTPILQSVPTYPTPFFSNPVYTFSVENGKIRKGEHLTLPHQANVFNFTTLMIQDELYLAVLFPALETISIYKYSSLNLLYKTIGSYSSTTQFMSLIPERTTSSKSDAIDELYYIPTHFTQLPSKDKRPILLLSNAVNRSSVTTTYRSFSKYSIEALRFSLEGFQSIWMSPPINASVADFDINIDEKGNVELFVLVTYTPILASFQKQRSSVLFQPISKGGE